MGTFLAAVGQTSGASSSRTSQGSGSSLYSMTNQGTSGSDATTSVGGIGAVNLNLSSAGLQKGVSTWALIAGGIVLAFVAYKYLRR